MAYLAFQDLGGASAVRAPAAAAVRAQAAAAAVASPPAERLSALEWSVVGLARRDGRATLRVPGRWRAILHRLLRRRDPRLADDRLEALRRMAVLAWQDGYAVPSHEVRAFLDAGFTPRQYETMVNYVSAARVIPPRTVAAD